MYPITMSFTINNEHQLARLISAANDGTLPASTIGASDTVAQANLQKKIIETAKVSEKKPDPVVSEKTAAASPSTATGQANAPAQSAESSAPVQESVSEATIESAKALTLKLVSAKGADFTRALLKEFNVPVAAKLAPEQVGPFVARAQEALAA